MIRSRVAAAWAWRSGELWRRGLTSVVLGYSLTLSSRDKLSYRGIVAGGADDDDRGLGAIRRVGAMTGLFPGGGDRRGQRRLCTGRRSGPARRRGPPVQPLTRAAGRDPGRRWHHGDRRDRRVRGARPGDRIAGRGRRWRWGGGRHRADGVVAGLRGRACPGDERWAADLAEPGPQRRRAVPG